MLLFQISMKYTAKELATVRHPDGHASRETVVRHMLEDLGGNLISFYWIMTPDAHVVAVAELPSSDPLFFISSLTDSSGVTVRVAAIELRTSAQADATIAQQTTGGRRSVPCHHRTELTSE